jgi:hypothetical protein
MRGRCSPGKLLAWWSPVRWTGYETSGRRLQLGSSLETRVADPDTHYFGLDPDQHYFLKLDPDPHWSEKLDPDPHYFGKLDPDPRYFGKLDPDPHYFGKQDPDTHWIEKLVPDPHWSWKSGALEAPWRAVDAHKGGVMAQNGALESVVDHWLQIRITLMRSRFRSGSALKWKVGSGSSKSEKMDTDSH